MPNDIAKLQKVIDNTKRLIENQQVTSTEQSSQQTVTPATGTAAPIPPVPPRPTG